MTERWRDVLGYEGLYQVSDLGNVMSLRFRQKAGARGPIKPKPRRNYVAVFLYKPDSKRKLHSVHKLVVEAFLGARPMGMQINHINGVKLNNALANLEYCTPSQNQKHSFRLGLQSNRGERHSQAKLNDEKVREILSLISAGKLSQTEIGRRMNVTQALVSNIKLGKAWTHLDCTKAQQASRGRVSV